MNAKTNDLVFELGSLRARQRRNPHGDRAARIRAIEAELDAVNYQFHTASVTNIRTPVV